MLFSELKRKVEGIRELATLPHVTTEVLSMLERTDVSIRQLSKIIETDPAITAKLLQIANSPFYGVRARVGNVQQAMALLGISEVSNLLLSLSLFSALYNSSNNSLGLMEQFWKHSTSVGFVARSLSKKVGLAHQERDFVGGLLHDIGKLILIQYFPDDMGKIIQKVHDEGISDIEAEKSVLEFTHQDIGVILAERWKLPVELIEIIKYHHEPQFAEKNPTLVAAVHLADLLSQIWGMGIIEGVQKVILVDENAWNIIKTARPQITKLDIERFTFELETEFKNASDFISVAANFSRN